MADKSYTDTIHDAPLLHHDNGNGTYSPAIYISGQVAGTMARNFAATYIASGVAYPGYATPTDLFTIRGSNTKKVAIILADLKVNTTAAALQTVQWIKRSTANTGGTSTNPTAVKFNSADPAATAQIDLYTAAPVLGTSAGTLNYQSALTTVPTAVPGLYNMSGVVTLSNAYTLMFSSLILNDATESLCCNWNGAALPTGFAAQWDVTWIEY